MLQIVDCLTMNLVSVCGLILGWIKTCTAGCRVSGMFLVLLLANNFKSPVFTAIYWTSVMIYHQLNWNWHMLNNAEVYLYFSLMLTRIIQPVVWLKILPHLQVIHQKLRITYEDLTSDLCPVSLSIFV